MKYSVNKYLAMALIFICSFNYLLAQSVIKENIIYSSGFVKSMSLKKSSDKSFNIFQDDMNGDNSITGLEQRGWVINDVDGGGSHPAWFQGNLYETNFSAYDGVLNGYVASDWSGGNSDDILDHWLISPQITVSDNDTISFWIQSLSNSDSISIYLSPDGGSNLADFSLAYDDGSNTQRYLVPQGEWSNWRGLVPAGNIRFAIRYHTSDAITYSFYLGIDLVEVLSSSIVIVFQPDVTTGAASSITSSSAMLNGTINPNGSNTTYSFEYGTTSSYGSTTSNTHELTGSSDIDVSEIIAGLTPNTLYHYRLTATNSGGTTNGSDVTFTTGSESLGADLELQKIIVYSFVWGVGSTITAELMVSNIGTATAASQQSQLYLSIDKTINSLDIPLGSPIIYMAIEASASITLSETFSVPSISDGIYYLGAIVDINGEVSESNENNNNQYRLGKIVVGQPETISLSRSVSFGSSSQSTSFRMLGIPGDVNIPITETLTGENGKDWIAYYDNGSSTDYLTSYNNSSTFDFKPGNGFWILANSNFSINRSINSVVLQSELMNNSVREIVYPISLHEGWNIISNPFENNVSWANVKLFNTVSEDIHSYNGNFSTSSVLEAYSGYYFYNATNLTSLWLPYNANGAISNVALGKDNVRNKISISILDDEKIRSSVSVGFNEEAIDGYDKYDRFSPPSDFQDYRISIYNEKLETNYKYLLNDERESSKNQNYRLQVKVPLGEYFNLEIEGAKKLSGESTYLVDQNNNFYDVKIQSAIKLKSSSEVNNLQLLTGDQEFINTKKENLLPKEYSLSQNYPNPFNSSTIIKYRIPNNQSQTNSNSQSINNVTLKVYDILGRVVTILVNSQQLAGMYELEWNAFNQPSGVYFYKLTAGTFKETKKMILLR